MTWWCKWTRRNPNKRAPDTKQISRPLDPGGAGLEWSPGEQKPSLMIVGEGRARRGGQYGAAEAKGCARAGESRVWRRRADDTGCWAAIMTRRSFGERESGAAQNTCTLSRLSIGTQTQTPARPNEAGWRAQQMKREGRVMVGGDLNGAPCCQFGHLIIIFCQQTRSECLMEFGLAGGRAEPSWCVLGQARKGATLANSKVSHPAASWARPRSFARSLLSACNRTRRTEPNRHRLRLRHRTLTSWPLFSRANPKRCSTAS